MNLGMLTPPRHMDPPLGFPFMCYGRGKNAAARPELEPGPPEFPVKCTTNKVIRSRTGDQTQLTATH